MYTVQRGPILGSSCRHLWLKLFLDITDTEVRRCGEQVGLDTPVVHTVTDAG